MPRQTLLSLALALALPAAAFSTAAHAQDSGPQAPVYAASKTPYPGTIQLEVDATNLSQRIFQVKQRIPVQAGSAHPAVPEMAAGQPRRLRPRRQGRGPGRSPRTASASTWTRDPLDVFAFKVDVPQARRRSTSLPVPLADRRRAGPRRHDAEHAQPAMEHGRAVSGRLRRERDHLRADRQTAGGLGVGTALEQPSQPAAT